jgi:PAS domain S-box-containing protein
LKRENVERDNAAMDTFTGVPLPIDPMPIPDASPIVHADKITAPQQEPSFSSKFSRIISETPDNGNGKSTTINYQSSILNVFATAVVNREGNFISANQKFSEITGYQTDELQKLSLADIIHPAEIIAVQEKESQTFSPRKFINRNGQTVFTNFLSLQNDPENGNKIIFIEDITQQVLTSKALQQAKADVSAVIENTNDFIFSCDVNHVITVINSAYKNFFALHYEKNIHPGDNYKSQLPKSEQKQWQQNHTAVLR